MKPLKLMALYDNGGKTADRYTAVTDERHDNFFNMLGFSEQPTHPTYGFSQWSGGIDGAHLGKKIKFEDLSPELQQHVAQRLWPDTD